MAEVGQLSVTGKSVFSEHEKNRQKRREPMIHLQDFIPIVPHNMIHLQFFIPN